MSKAKREQKKAARKAAKKKVPAKFAKAAKHANQEAATRLIRKARRLAMKFRMSLQPYKHHYCKHCYKRLRVGENARVRIHGGKIIYHCNNCKNYRRIPLKAKVKG